MSDNPRPRWLNASEMETWLALVGVMRTLPGELDRALRRDAGITLFDYLTLAMLSQAPEDTLTCSELARQVDGSLSRLSHTLDRLAAHGWVTRSHHGEDRRIVHATLTPAGREIVERTAPAHVRTVRELVFDPLSDAQAAQLGQACSQIAERVRRSSSAGGAETTAPGPASSPQTAEKNSRSRRAPSQRRARAASA